jgi:hypothetical protein
MVVSPFVARTIEHRLRQAVRLRIGTNYVRREKNKHFCLTSLPVCVPEQTTEKWDRAENRYSSLAHIPLLVR